MDIKAIRKLNQALIHAKARVTRAELAAKLAERSLNKAQEALDKALNEFDGVPCLNAVEKTFCREGSPIQAIRSLRARYDGLGLKDAKDLIDAWRDQNGLGSNHLT
jgi:ribosomal protein L7/L12